MSCRADSNGLPADLLDRCRPRRTGRGRTRLARQGGAARRLRAGTRVRRRRAHVPGNPRTGTRRQRTALGDLVRRRRDGRSAQLHHARDQRRRRKDLVRPEARDRPRRPRPGPRLRSLPVDRSQRHALAVLVPGDPRRGRRSARVRHHHKESGGRKPHVVAAEVHPRRRDDEQADRALRRHLAAAHRDLAPRRELPRGRLDRPGRDLGTARNGERARSEGPELR